MAMASIDIAAMRTLISRLTGAGDTLDSSASSIQSASQRVWGSASEAQTIRDAASWVREQVPGLRRRLTLAELIEAQTPGVQGVVQIDESKLSNLTPEQAESRAREMLYVGLSRARDLLVVCGDLDLIRRVGGEGVARRLTTAVTT